MLIWLIAWVLISLRSLGVIAALPTPGGGTLPTRVRVALSMILAVLLVGVVPLPVALQTADWIQLAMAAVSEVLLGFAMGLVVRAALSITALGGRLIANEIGLNSPLRCAGAGAGAFTGFRYGVCGGVVFWDGGAS